MRFKFLIYPSLGLLLWACGSQPSFVRAPFEGVVNEVIEQVMDAGTGGVLLVGNGTEIHVPKDAFVNQKGEPINGEVTIAFTEMSDPSSILISGIPLHYGDRDDPRVMESAGMFDVSAFANGERLKLADGKTIRTIFSSNVDGDQYEFFRLDEAARTWEPLGETETIPNPAIDRLTDSITAKMDLAKMYDVEQCFAFNYGFDLDVVMEKDQYKLKDSRFNYYTWKTAPAIRTLNNILRTKLAAYGVHSFLDERVWEEITWKGGKWNPNLLLWKSEKPIPTWIMNSKKHRYVELTKLKGDRYKLQFMRSEYKDGWKNFIDFTTYVTVRMPLEELYADAAETRSETYMELLAQMEREREVLAAQNQVLREFNISEMGVYNYDYIKDEERLLVEAALYLDGEPLSNQVTDLFVVVKDQNTVLRYSEEGLNRFVIYPEQKLFAFMVSEGNAIAMQVGSLLDDIDVKSFQDNPSKKLRIDLSSTDYVINEPADLTLFLDREVNGIVEEELLSMN